MDKRKITRTSFHISAVIEHEGRQINGEIINVSLKGVYIKSAEKVEVGQILKLHIYLSEEKSPEYSVHLSGEVRQAQEGGFGLKFTEMDLDSFTILKNIVVYNEGDSDRVMHEFLASLEENS